MRMVFRAATAATVILIVRATYGFGAPESEAKQAQPEATRLRADALRARPLVSAVSAQDKAEIVEIFEGVDPSLYRLQFDGGRETFGTAKISMRDIRQTTRFTNPLDEHGWIVFVVETKSQDVIYVLAASGKDLTSVLGAQKVSQLKTLSTQFEALAR